MSFFFFFQAEDGIRDLYVTGVQTCALPISFPAPPRCTAMPCSTCAPTAMPGGSRSKGEAADRRAASARVAGKVFTTREVARLARLTPSRVRRCARAGVVAPTRGLRRRYEYTLRDLMLLRATRTLLDA